MFKKIISYLISFFIFYTPIFANAASTQEKWNNARNQEIRNTIGQNATYGNNSGRITVRNYDATKKMVEASLSRSATVNGSKASVEAAVKVPVNVAKSAATIAKRLGKGGIAGMLGGAAVSALIDGIGLIIDEGGKVKRLPTDVSNNFPIPPYVYRNPVTSAEEGLNAYQACAMLGQYHKSKGNWKTYSITGFNVNTDDCSYIVSLPDGRKDIPVSTKIFRYAADSSIDPELPLYDVPQNELNDDIAERLQKEVDAGSDLGKQLIKDAYQAVDAMGKATNDLGKAVDGLNDAVKDLTDAFDKIVKSDDPVATGNTDSVPTITTGGETSGDTDTQNKDKDGNDTGSSNSTSNFQLPAFCDWAADNCEWHQEDKKHQADQKNFWDKVADWFDWTKDESDLPEKDDTDLNITTDFEEKKVSLNVSAQCPAPTYETVTLHGVTAQVKTSDYSFICSLDWLIKPFVIGFAMVTACFILFGFQRGGEE